MPVVSWPKRSKSLLDSRDAPQIVLQSRLRDVGVDVVTNGCNPQPDHAKGIVLNGAYGDLARRPVRVGAVPTHGRHDPNGSPKVRLAGPRVLDVQARFVPHGGIDPRRRQMARLHQRQDEPWSKHAALRGVVWLGVSQVPVPTLVEVVHPHGHDHHENRVSNTPHPPLASRSNRCTTPKKLRTPGANTPNRSITGKTLNRMDTASMPNITAVLIQRTRPVLT